jgi:hypothetical protein
MASRNLRGKGLRSSSKRQDFNPSEGILNLADVMLVFACGLMLSLVINWNIDINVEEVDMEVGSEVDQVENMEENMAENMNSEEGYEKMGTLYKDPVTGKLYMLTQEE